MIVEARYYSEIADSLLEGAKATLDKAGATYEKFEAPGAFEIPAAISYALIEQDMSDMHRFDGYLALGCVIRGETSHYDHICEESARALMSLSVEYGLALGNGILTVENQDQAWARARLDEKDKGGEAAAACLAMIDHKKHFKLYPRDL